VQHESEETILTLSTARDPDTESDDGPDTESGAEADAGDTEEPASGAAEPGTEVRTRRWPRRVLMGLTVTAFVAAVVGCGVLGSMVWQQRALASAGEQARTAAVSYAQILTSIDSNQVDQNFDQVLDGATGEFKDMYSQSSMQLRQLLIDNKASAHGVVVDSAIQSTSDDEVVVLLFVDQSVSNASVPDPRIDRSRIKMTMSYVDGRWRASKVELP
jgi:Mce-associated membrane protein